MSLKPRSVFPSVKSVGSIKLQSVYRIWPNGRECSAQSSQFSNYPPILKILFFIRSLDSGGAERQLVHLAKSLGEQGHEVVVMVMYSGGLLEQTLEQANVPVRALEKTSRWDLFRPLFRMINTMREVNPEILHSYMTEVNVISIICKIVRPTILLVWGVRNAGLDRRMYGSLERTLAWLEKRCSSVPDLIIANSEAGRTLAIQEGFRGDHFEVVKNGIDTTRLFRDEGLRREAREFWGVGNSEKVLGIVGRVDPQKDHENLILAVSLLSEEQKNNIKVLCVGHDTDEQIAHLRLKCEQLGLKQKVIWVAKQHNINKIFNAIDVLVSASNAEGFSNVIAEALAVGVPCVATDVGDSKQIISEFGGVAPPKNPQALSQAIAAVLENIDLFTEEFRVSARSYILETFSIAKLSQETERLLQQLISNNRTDVS